MSPAEPARVSVRDRLGWLLGRCRDLDASDLHLSPGYPPLLRRSGVLESLGDEPAMTSPDVAALAEQLRGDAGALPLSERGDLDGALTTADGTRFRFNVYRRQGAIAIALRRLEERIPDLAELGLPDSLYQLCDLRDGLVLVAGPTGSGKSTTLATLIDRINRSRACHIITIEDPIEYLHAKARALVNQRQIGQDAPGFGRALVASLRQDPDVILVGEIREAETIRTAITAGETGHLVLSTVHAGDCVGAVERVVAAFGADEQAGIRRQLALVLRAVVSQHLVLADGPRANAGRRVVVSEVLRSTSAVANLIAGARSNQIYSAMETGTAQGMQTFEQDLERLVGEGSLSPLAARALATHPELLERRLSRRRT